MEKSFWKWKITDKTFYRLLIVFGTLLTIVWAVKSWKNTGLSNENELLKKDAAKGSYVQELIARVGDEKVALNVTVEERRFSKEEADDEFARAERILEEVLKGENASLLEVRDSINFVDEIPGTAVEAEWVRRASEYFYYNGQRREDVKITEPVEIEISALLSCQEYVRDYETIITLLPEVSGTKEKLFQLIETERSSQQESPVLKLPNELDGQKIFWKKPLDTTFLYFPGLMVLAVAGLKIGRKRDEEVKKKERLTELERSYAQIVSKFTMLLSAGLNIRNAWERIVVLHQKEKSSGSVVYEELEWGLREMKKGVSELEIYEKFGTRTGQVHYKKLMALFISDKRHGSVKLLDAMNQEMLLAWEEQKRKTRQQGEIIGTKLLLPMMGMLAVVFVMILVPAFLSF